MTSIAACPRSDAVGPVDECVERLHPRIREVSDTPHVEIQLADGSRFAVEPVAAAPGYGFVTLHPDDTKPPFGFALPR